MSSKKFIIITKFIKTIESEHGSDCHLRPPCWKYFLRFLIKILYNREFLIFLRFLTRIYIRNWISFRSQKLKKNNFFKNSYFWNNFVWNKHNMMFHSSTIFILKIIFKCEKLIINTWNFNFNNDEISSITHESVNIKNVYYKFKKKRIKFFFLNNQMDNILYLNPY